MIPSGFPTKRGNRPRMFSCYICGQQFGSKSLPIHIPQCQKKREYEQQQLPKHLRTPCPRMPKEGSLSNDGSPKDLSKMSSTAIDQFNKQSFDAYNNESLVPCERCGRTFLPKSLIVHQRSCKGEKKKSTIRNPSSLVSNATVRNPSSSQKSPSKSPSKSKTLKREKRSSPKNQQLNGSEKSYNYQGSPANTGKSSSRVFQVPEDTSMDLPSPKPSTFKTETSKHLNIKVQGSIPVRAYYQDSEKTLRIEILKGIDCTIEGSGPDEDGRYIFEGQFKEWQEKPLFSHNWTNQGNFSVIVQLSRTYDTPELSQVQKDTENGILTLYYKRKTISQTKKIEL